MQLSPDFVKTIHKIAAGSRKYLKAEYGVNGLLADFVSNPKVMKGMKEVAVATSPMHLAPATLSGFNVCARASKGCIKACLHTAGNPLHMQGKRKARINRTKAYFGARNDFMLMLCSEIIRAEIKAHRLGMEHAVRLNATSDIQWEKVPVTIGDTTYRNLMELFPLTTFYDYTKISNRKKLPDNYSLTFSLAEDNDAYAEQAIVNGMNVAVVFDLKRSQKLPETFTIGDTTLPVLDGDVHDYRPADERGRIVGLRAKGLARTDQSGFVRKAA